MADTHLLRNRRGQGLPVNLIILIVIAIIVLVIIVLLVNKYAKQGNTSFNNSCKLAGGDCRSAPCPPGEEQVGGLCTTTEGQPPQVCCARTGA